MVCAQIRKIHHSTLMGGVSVSLQHCSHATVSEAAEQWRKMSNDVNSGVLYPR